VAIVNETFARHYFGNAQSALGHHVMRPRRPETDSMIVGVVRDAKHTSVRDPAMATAYRPFVQAEKPAGLTFYVRTWQPPSAAAASIRAAVGNLDSKLIVHDLTTLGTIIDDTISNERTVALLASAFGALATLLAGIGLYGILAYSTAQRTREIGIRMALGAQRWAVVRLILREVLVLAGISIAVTIPISIVATRALRSQLFNVSSTDANVYAIAITVVVFVAALAGLIPARRAASVEPMRALRTE
jgi:predicted lysophospholipase L1 biosynthesis ABC-type transport system permease subunit